MDIKAYIESGIIESYVLGMATPEEEAELQQLSLLYPEVRAAVSDGEKWLRDVSDQYAEETPDNLKTALLANLNPEFRTEVQVSPVFPSSRVHLFKYAAAVALLLLAISGLLNIYLYNRYKKASHDIARLQSAQDMILADNRVYQTKMTSLYRDMQIITAPGTLRVTLSGVADRKDNQVTLYWNTHTKDVYLTVNKLPAPPAGKQYQLWALVDGKPVSAGLLDNHCKEICSAMPVQQAQAFAITLENAGGSATPTLEQMFVLGNVKS